jgi:predicted O-linked N-acetylglucosamine transferase (SPINDLY family)
MSLAATLQDALQLHQQGRLGEAEARYRQILALQPRHPDALHLLGLIAMSAGHFDTGIDLMQRSVAANPAQPAVLLNLARACTQTARREAALAAYDRALTLHPDFSDALYERANACLMFKQPQAALDGYDRLLRRMPSHADAWSNRGNALQELGRQAEAVESYDRSLALQPGSAVAHNNRGNALRALQRFEDALPGYDRALQLDPRLANAHNNRGMALSKLSRPEEALAAFERALALTPVFTDALNNRGNALRELGQPAAALECYERVLQLDPAYAEAFSNRGNALKDLERYAEALESYDRALHALPDSPDILANRAAALSDMANYDAASHCLRRLLRVAPRYDYALGSLLQSNWHNCVWEQYDSLLAQVTSALAEGQRVIHPFTMMVASASAAVQLCAAQLHAAATPTPRGAAAPELASAAVRRKLRIAYVSADFREHAASYLLAGVFEHHDRERFETVAVSLRPPEGSAMGRRVAAAFGRFEDVSRRNDREVASLLRELQIDIAVDLMGYTHKARPGILAHRPAPVQVSYLGYPGTMGAPFIDYILADEFVIPPASRQYYSEQVVYLPECFQANDDRCVVGPKPTRAQVGLPQEGLVLCCINNNYKLNPPLFEIWMRLLHEVPDSVLWLLADRESAQANLQREALARGIRAERLVFAARMPYAQHLGRLGLADLFLDTLPYNAGATASNALRTGVPVLTCAGEAFASRMAGSLLKSMGLPELITHSPEEYERKALELAREPQVLQGLRARLAENLPHAPLFDTARFCRHLEAAYLTMSERAMRDEKPAAFSVTPGP